MTRVLVTHQNYGCDTGCCGHSIEIDGREIPSTFDFDHPFGQDRLEWAKNFILKQLGEEHVKDLDWENSVVLDY